ncbi:MAG: peptidoglycan DD-metalloendopeptidase family protein [Nitrospinae bacterium]|nr:peptidoglycan DD-metalloendopeptidase family protein [Nitrospinota bacterium]
MNGGGIDESLAIERLAPEHFNQGKGKVYYYHADGLGSVTALTDSKGKVVQRYDYDSFGNLKHRGHKVKQPYTYTGREWDRETGLYYYRMRYYDPEIGRFLQIDPFPGFIELPQTLNHYSYVGDNPMNWVDPLGLTTWPASGTVSSEFGEISITRGNRPHTGIDISNPHSSNVVASDGGIVISTVPSPNGTSQVIILNNDGSVSGYAHVSPSVKMGQRVEEGEVIGITDMSGISTGPHLHYTYRPDRNSPRINPREHLPSRGSCR